MGFRDALEMGLNLAKFQVFLVRDLLKCLEFFKTIVYLCLQFVILLPQSLRHLRFALNLASETLIDLNLLRYLRDYHLQVLVVGLNISHKSMLS